MPPTLFLLLIAVTIHNTLWFNMNFRIFPNFLKMLMDFDRDFIESIDHFVYLAIQ
jgi:hypothetical protein